MKNIELHYAPRDPSGKDPMTLFDRLTVTAEIGGETFYWVCETQKPIEELSVAEIVEVIGELLDSMNEEQEKYEMIVLKLKNESKDKGKTVRVKKKEIKTNERRGED